MENELRKAGIDVDHARLTEIAFETLRHFERNMAKATRSVRTSVISDGRLMAALIGHEELNNRIEAFLRDRIDDMNAGRGVSQFGDDSQRHLDHPTSPPNQTEEGAGASLSAEKKVTPPPSSCQRGRLSQREHESLPYSDQPSAPTAGDGVSHANVDRQRDTDRPAPGTSISRSAACAVAGSGIWNKRVMSHFEKTYGEITQYDLMNLRINTAVMLELRKGLEDVRWPGLHVPLKDFEDPDRIEALSQRVDAARDAELAQVKEIAHAD